MLNLLIVIIAIVCDRVLGLDPKLRCYKWFDHYLHLLKGWFEKTALWQDWLGVIVILLPLIIIVGFFNWLFSGWLFNLISLIYGVVILLYCLGPADLYQQFGHYKEALDLGDKELATKTSTGLAEKTLPADTNQAARTLTESLFVQANQRIFAVLFWFIILGPVGAVLYRFTVVLKKQAEHHEIYDCFETPASQLQAVLDWIPARIVAILFALAGDFKRGFTVWIKHVWGGLHSSYQLLTACGLEALAEKSSKADLAENQQALELIDRTLWIWMIIYAIVAIFAWVF